jgi:hypothetical protein
VRAWRSHSGHSSHSIEVRQIPDEEDSVRLVLKMVKEAIPMLAESRCCRLKVYLHMSSACRAWDTLL